MFVGSRTFAMLLNFLILCSAVAWLVLLALDLDGMKMAGPAHEDVLYLIAGVGLGSAIWRSTIAIQTGQAAVRADIARTEQVLVDRTAALDPEVVAISARLGRRLSSAVDN